MLQEAPAPEQTAEPLTLPEGIGNADLDRLQEIAAPEAVALTPQTIGWTVLGVLLLATVGLYAWRFGRRWWRNRYRRAALRELRPLRKQIADPGTRAEGLLALARLLKRAALRLFPRQDVAALTGQSWLDFLDNSAQMTGFSVGDGKIFADLAYLPPAQRAAIPDEVAGEAVSLVRQWVRRAGVERE